jgi:hypothetical protein
VKKDSNRLERTPQSQKRCRRLVEDCAAQLVEDIGRLDFDHPEAVHCYIDGFFGGLRRQVEMHTAGPVIAALAKAAGLEGPPELEVIPLGDISPEQVEEMKELAEGVSSAAPEDQAAAMEKFMEWVAGQKKQAEKGERFRDN